MISLNICCFCAMSAEVEDLCAPQGQRQGSVVESVTQPKICLPCAEKVVFQFDAARHAKAQAESAAESAESNKPSPHSRELGAIDGWYVPLHATPKLAPGEPPQWWHQVTCFWPSAEGHPAAVVRAHGKRARPWRLHVDGKFRAAFAKPDAAMRAGDRIAAEMATTHKEARS
jgi:hypothetical protein